MRLVVEHQEITVSDTTAPEVSIDPTQSASAQVMRSDDLDAISDDADDLLTDLQALAGPGAGLNGGQIFIDGFTAGDGTLPSKDAIREVRINQNPFAPEFDTLGTGHIEILTKPGTDHLRGQVYFGYGDGLFNSRNPYAEQKAPFNMKDFGGNLSGRFSSKGSFFLDFISDSSAIEVTDVVRTSSGKLGADLVAAQLGRATVSSAGGVICPPGQACPALARLWRLEVTVGR